MTSRESHSSDETFARPDSEALDAILTAGGVTAVFQPVVELPARTVVAYEALARGPAGSRLERPDLLFRAARASGRLAELDWTCRAAAIEAALEASLERPLSLFLNVEPEVIDGECPPHLRPVWQRAKRELDVVLEITERALTARPAELLAAVERVRRRGWGIALDDVGADTRSLALMPLLRPDVIKLDLRLVQDQPDTEIAEIVNAVNAQRERSGAQVLAEGIETEAQLATAQAMGASYGQGWLFGRPAALERHPPPPAVGVARLDRLSWETTGETPFQAVSPVREVRRADKRLLLSISLYLEQQAAALGSGAVILSAFQDAAHFTKSTHRRYTSLAADASLVGALGVGMGAEPAPGVRGASLEPDDALLGEWSVAVLGPHFAAALVAVDCGDRGPEWERRFDYALTYDRDLVIQAAITLLRRVVPLSEVPMGETVLAG